MFKPYRLVLCLCSAFLSSCLLSVGADAQGKMDVPPPCPTLTGEPGRLFVNISNVFEVPEVFDRVQGAGETVVGHGLGTTPPTVYALAFSEGASAMRFFNGEELVYECAVNAIDFDPAVHSMTSIEKGYCDWQADRDLPVLTGIAHVFVLPTGFLEVAVGNPNILDIRPTSDRSIVVFGRSTGITDVVALGGNGVLISQCPFVVQDAAQHFAQIPVKDTELCRDSNGNLMRLTQGDAVMYKREGEVRRYDPVHSADKGIARPAQNRSETGLFEIRARSPGITSLIDYRYRARNGSLSCLIVVE